MLSLRTYPRPLDPLDRPTGSGWPCEQRGVKRRWSGFGGDQVGLRFKPGTVPCSILHYLHLPGIVRIAELALHVPIFVSCLHFERPIGSLEAVGVGAVSVELVDVSKDRYDGGGALGVISRSGSLRPRPRAGTQQQNLEVLRLEVII